MVHEGNDCVREPAESAPQDPQQNRRGSITTFETRSRLGIFKGEGNVETQADGTQVVLTTDGGARVKYCGRCGSLTNRRIPEGDHLPRRVCETCGTVHYENPTLVVGCVPEHHGRILICRRAIEPRRGYWTLPAGFIEHGETLEAGAIRECWEETQARVEIDGLLAVVSIPEIHQVLMFFRALLPEPQFGPGAESLDTRLVLPEEIPWDNLAFSSTRFVLERYLAERVGGRQEVHLTTLAAGWPS